MGCRHCRRTGEWSLCTKGRNTHSRRGRSLRQMRQMNILDHTNFQGHTTANPKETWADNTSGGQRRRRVSAIERPSSNDTRRRIRDLAVDARRISPFLMYSPPDAGRGGPRRPTLRSRLAAELAVRSTNSTYRAARFRSENGSFWEIVAGLP